MVVTDGGTAAVPTAQSLHNAVNKHASIKQPYAEKHNSKLHLAAAGLGSGVIASFVTAPLDVVKTRLQVQQAGEYHTPMVALRRILVDEGVRGYFKGFGTLCIGLGPNWAIYFTAYNHYGRHNKRVHVLSAVSAGAVTSIITNPFWVIKTRLQSQYLASVTHEYTGFFHAVRTIYATEGVAAFFRGVIPSLFGLVHVAIQFPLYEALKQHFRDKKDDPTKPLSSVEIMMSSSASKAVASCIGYPHEVIRARMQNENGDGPHTNMLNSIRTVFREHGWRGFYQGMTTNLIRVVPACAITFTSYELILKWLDERYDHKHKH